MGKHMRAALELSFPLLFFSFFFFSYSIFFFLSTYLGKVLDLPIRLHLLGTKILVPYLSDLSCHGSRDYYTSQSKILPYRYRTKYSV